MTVLASRVTPLLCLLLGTSAFAAPPPEVASSSSGIGIGRDKGYPLRVRLGVLGGLSMQKTQAMVGASYDVLTVAKRFRVVGDLTIGFRAHEVTLLPMAGVRLPFDLKRVPKLEPYVAALVGVNLTFMRGGVGMAVPVRMSLGAHYEVLPSISVGGELSTEVGPLVAPFADTYAALHFSGLVAFKL